MVIGFYTVFSCATNFLNGRKCVFFWGSFKTVKTARSLCQMHSLRQAKKSG
jgi:hypothetical protein